MEELNYSEINILLGLMALIWCIALLALVSRVSHWANCVYQELKHTNQLMIKLITRADIMVGTPPPVSRDAVDGPAKTPQTAVTTSTAEGANAESPYVATL